MREKYILYGLLVLVILAAVFVFSGFSIGTVKNSNLKVVDKDAGSSSSFKSIDSGSTSNGDVSIELTPLGFEDGKLNVKISVNTHSVSLEQFDLKQIAVLEYSGKSIAPISAPILEGHHSNGVLVFDIGEGVDVFTIKIKGIPKVEERVFKWG